MESNTYSAQWFSVFHAPIPQTRTDQETAFICAQAPLPRFRTVADVCCGMGRHARALSARGYSVTAIERDATAVDEARKLAGGPTYIQADVREYAPEPGSLDAVVIMSQVFGHFDATTNRDVLRGLINGVRDGGRVLLDLWNPDFFAAHQGTWELHRPAGTVLERKRVEADRLFVHLDYPDGGSDDFDWEMFTASQMTRLATSVGARLIVNCTDFDASVLPSPDKPRVQFVLECGV